jgi:putative ABC transport system substrate-binding protein
MRRREFITLLGGAAATWPLAAQGQQSGRMRRIGLLESGGGTFAKTRAELFRATLAQLGWHEGGNVQLHRREALADERRARAYAEELVSMAPDVIVATNTQMVQLLQERTRTIPIVFCGVPDSVVGTLVGSVARPTGNATGFINFHPAMASKWLEILKEAVPSLNQVVVLLHAGNPTAPGYFRAIEKAAPSFALKLVAAEARDTTEIKSTIESFALASGRGMVVPPSSLVSTNESSIIALTAQYRLPAIYSYPDFVANGGLMSYGFDRFDDFRQVAIYVDRILRGAKPSDLPVQAPTKFELVINLKTAKALGLTISEAFLLRADQVIE